MKNIWYQKKETGVNGKVLFSILMLTVVIIWALYGINIAKVANKEQEKIQMTENLNRAVALCYSIEGMYPPDIDYLVDNYGVNIDSDKYIVKYDIFASNYKPKITVIEIGE